MLLRAAEIAGASAFALLGVLLLCTFWPKTLRRQNDTERRGAWLRLHLGITNILLGVPLVIERLGYRRPPWTHDPFLYASLAYLVALGLWCGSRLCLRSKPRSPAQPTIPADPGQEAPNTALNRLAQLREEGASIRAETELIEAETELLRVRMSKLQARQKKLAQDTAQLEVDYGIAPPEQAT